MAYIPTNADYENITSSMLNILSMQSLTGISGYKEYFCIPLDANKPKALEAEFGEALGITNPDMCKIFASRFCAYQFEDF